jgi:hypothetical protein
MILGGRFLWTNTTQKPNVMPDTIEGCIIAATLKKEEKDED